VQTQPSVKKRGEIDPIELSIVIPLYNEAVCLSANVARISSYLRTLAINWEIILVNDGSRDHTACIGRQISEGDSQIHLKSYPGNRGKGYAVKTGMLAAKGRFRIFMDADLAVPPEFTGDFLAKLRGGAPVVIGSRHRSGACFKIPEGTLRTTLGRIYRKLTLFSLGLKVTDITCGLKGFDATAAIEVFSRSKIDRWGYDAEILFLSERLGYPIEETPVDWYHSFHSAVNVVRDSVGTMIEMLRICLYYRRNLYKLP